MVALTLVDGVLAESVPVSDRGLLYGDGVFETMRCSRGQVTLLPAHLQRLQQSCEQLGIPLVMAEIQGHIDALLSLLMSAKDTKQDPGSGPDGVVKIIVTRGDGGRGYAPPVAAHARSIVQFHPMPARLAEFARDGVSCMMCQQPVSDNPALAGLKHLNRLDQVMASRELIAAQQRPDDIGPLLQEGLMCDSNGRLIEGTRTNVFAVIDGHLCTPDLSRAGVSGVMRQALLTWYAGQGIDVTVRDIAVDELRVASELFICNSVLGVWPVNSIHDFKRDWLVRLPEQTMARRARNGLPAG